jgi:hypothetical protein
MHHNLVGKQKFLEEQLLELQELLVPVHSMPGLLRTVRKRDLSKMG